ncbi:MAG: ankyrin repeat domain-containing protein [Myxococcota bacterium]
MHWLIGAIPLLAAGHFLGPVSGRVELSDGAHPQDVVVRLRCSSYNFHGASASDTETRVVAAGQTFRFLWAWRGLSPVGCWLQIYHPLYVAGHVALSDAFSQDVGEVRLESWDAFLARGGSTGMDHQPWPLAELQQHLHFMRYHFAPATDGAVRYLPALHGIFDHAVRELPRGWHLGSSQNRYLLQNLQGIEQVTGYRRSAAQEALFVAAGAGDALAVGEALAAGADPSGWDADGAGALHLAAAGGQLEVVTLLLDAGVPVDARMQAAGNTALIQAMLRHRSDVARLLIARGADVSLGSWKGTPLRIGARQGMDPELMRLLLDRGAVTRAAEERDVVLALHEASRNGRTGIVRALLDAGVPVDAGSGGFTALFVATLKGKLATSRLLIEAGADVNLRASDGRTPLANARKRGDPRLIAVLKAAGARE